jgi:hypothetical protein
MVRPFIWYHDLDPLTLEFDLLFKNFNLGHNFWFVGGRAFIFHLCIPSGKTFLLISWPWHSDLGPWSLTFFSKTLTLVITFDWWVVVLHISLVFSFWQDLSFDTMTLTHWYLTFFPKTLTLIISRCNCSKTHSLNALRHWNFWWDWRNSANSESFGGALSDLVSFLVTTKNEISVRC